ncbi:TIGR02147 family protein [Bdellovibrio bacteriovorus]|uniref:DUF4423 domain-containing protein n=1 Tax=Bdellovibrio bacteriovorus str. Tiberius TaxID=1069642 RepID=K7YWJ9_BDEBC|nr:TIGR02147 family protein [Bdellovibrio bacteriovorus]AFY01090.1 hypothetical protein Bdt_1392 [Bdellovibrio bacteriovorus str. Tiberius]
MNTKNFVDVLKDHYKEKRAGDRHFSQRAYARYIGIDDSRLSKILRGKRPIHPELVEAIGRKIQLSDQAIEAFKKAELQKYRRHTRRAKNNMVKLQKIPLETFKIISDPQHYHILELLKLKSFQPDVQWVAVVMGIPVSQAQECIDRLQAVGLLRIENDGTWIDISDGFTTDILSDVAASEAHRRFQKAVLLRSVQALQDLSLGHRDQSSILVATDSRKLHEAKQMIKAFRRKLGLFLSESETKDQVFQLSLSLYPLNKEE